MNKMYQYQEYGYLDERLAVYANTDYYPFHMPGHKRADLDFENPYKVDITEIEGFDNLHHAREILFQSQQRLSDLYHSKKAYYLINGSTCGILSAIGAVVKRGDHIIMARNSHKSVYHAVKLFGLRAAYVYPKIMECGIPGDIAPEDVENSLKMDHRVKAVILTSPTYDGIVSDIGKLADMIHRYHAYLIVDEAHGAHFSLDGRFPESAVRKDADLVVQSLHKTLPCFTQTAALHIASDRVECHKVEEMLHIFQTSSPSYLLMAGIDRCIRLLKLSGKKLFDEYYGRLLMFYKKCEALRFFHVLTEEDYKAFHVFAVDPSKIAISTTHTSINGQQLYERLLNQYHLQLELYSAQYVLAMTSIMDRQEGFDRLFSALVEIEQEISETAAECAKEKHQYQKYKQGVDHIFLQDAYAFRKKAMDISEADNYSIEETALHDSIGKVCAEYIYLYPPGIPFIVPGEILTKEFINILNECRKMKLNIQGMKDQECKKILTLVNN